jgi:16S rRNA (cytosine1402-N4)-methyltransferase
LVKLASSNETHVCDLRMDKHITVLLHEAVEALQIQTDSTVFDATYGVGGHGTEILKLLDKKGTYIGVDVDETALKNQPYNPHEATVHLVNENFKNFGNILGSLHIKKVDAILADLGWRMEQFGASGKGLSFSHDEPLLMTYGASSKYSFTAKDIVNEWSEETLADIIFGYGEERYAKRIAKVIVSERAKQPITTTFQLRDCVMKAVPKSAHFKKTHPATKTFQALRIAVNEELTSLEQFIHEAVSSLSPNGRLAIITFHSLEDRIVKHSFRSLAQAGVVTLVNKKPILPEGNEIRNNPRARSAKLRVVTKHNVEHERRDQSFCNWCRVLSILFKRFCSTRSHAQGSCPVRKRRQSGNCRVRDTVH